MDREDLEQEALVGVWLAIAMSGYDPSRASPRTFAERVVASKLTSALRRVSASKRTPRTRPETRECVDVFVRINFRVDIERVLSKLRKTDKKVLRLLFERTPSEVAQILGISRQAVYRSMQRIRIAFRKAGLGEFL
jgi:RNA polymerase sigma factor (sigma-70 family)